MEVFRPKEYFRPSNVPEALTLLSSYRGKARIIAGGTDLLVQKPSGIECLIDIADLGLDYIRKTDRGISIGAATKVEAIENSQLFRQDPFTVLSQAASIMAAPTIRNMATIGGNICNASPAADLSIALMALNAVVEVIGSNGSRRLPIGEYFEDVRKTNLKDDELLIEVNIPQSPSSAGACFLKLRRHQTAVDLAVVNVAIKLICVDDFCKDVRIALGAVAKTPIYATEAQNFLVGKKLDDEVIRKAATFAAEESSPIDDVRAKASYRKRMVEVLVRRALEVSIRRCQLWQN